MNLSPYQLWSLREQAKRCPMCAAGRLYSTDHWWQCDMCSYSEPVHTDVPDQDPPDTPLTVEE